MKSKSFYQVVALVAVSGLLLNPFTARAVEVKVQVNRGKSFGDSSVLIVPNVVLKLPVAGKVFVAKQGSALSTLGGGSANSVKASAHYTVTGLEKKFAQELAAKVYDDFVKQLRAAGFTVKTYDDIKDSDVVKNAKMEANDKDWGLPVEKDAGGNNVFILATPSDAQAFKSGLVGGVFNQFMKRGQSTLGEGTIIMPSYVIAAPQAWGEKGGGYKTISASVNVVPGMNLTSAIASLLTEKGGWGDVRTKEQVINIGEKVGELTKQDTTPTTGNAVSSALSFLSGAGKISSKSANYQMAVDRAAYEAALLQGTMAFNVEVAKAAGSAKK